MKVHIHDIDEGREIYFGEHRSVHTAAEALDRRGGIKFVSKYCGEKDSLVIGVKHPQVLVNEPDGTLWVGQSMFPGEVVWSEDMEKKILAENLTHD